VVETLWLKHYPKHCADSVSTAPCYPDSVSDSVSTVVCTSDSYLEGLTQIQELQTTPALYKK